MLVKHCKLASGISKCIPICLSIVLPCFVKNVEYFAKKTLYIKHVIQISNNPRTSFTSSTSWTVHSRQLKVVLHSSSNSSSTVGFSRNLKNENEDMHHKYLSSSKIEYALCYQGDGSKMFHMYGFVDNENSTGAYLFTLFGVVNSE